MALMFDSLFILQIHDCMEYSGNRTTSQKLNIWRQKTVAGSFKAPRKFLVCVRRRIYDENVEPLERKYVNRNKYPI